MTTTRQRLERVEANLDESLGVRDGAQRRLVLSPQPLARDIGRRPIRNVGSVAIDQVIADPDQPRNEFSDEAIERLAQSISDKGQLSPIHVRWSDGEQKWVVISGERRFRAAKRAGLETVECRFHESEMTDSEVLEQQLIENLLREDLKPVEEAEGYVALMELNSWTGKQVAQYLHVPASESAGRWLYFDCPLTSRLESKPARSQHGRPMRSRSCRPISSNENWPSRSQEARYRVKMRTAS